MNDFDRADEKGLNRRKVLECMTWAGAGVLWTVTGGVPRSLGIVGEAMAAGAGSVTFMQISDSHIGFDKAANPDTPGTLQAAINKIKALPAKPAFITATSTSKRPGSDAAKQGIRHNCACGRPFGGRPRMPGAFSNPAGRTESAPASFVEGGGLNFAIPPPQ